MTRKERIQSEYSVRQRVFYWVKRNLVYLLLAALSLLIIQAITVSAEQTEETIGWAGLGVMIASSTLSVSVKAFIAFLIMKFALPSVAFQTEIVKYQNDASALVFFAIVWLVTG